MWNAPTEIGLYAFAYVTDEWRNGVKIAESLRTYVIRIKDLPGTPVPAIPPYEAVVFNANGTITALPFLEGTSPDVAPKVYPNPSSDYITVEVDDRHPAPTMIELIDSQGRVLQRVAHEAGTSSHVHVLRTADLAKGVYIIRVQSENGILTRKFVH